MSLEKYVGLSHFSPDEFDQPEKMDEYFLKLLDKTREEAGIPFKLSSTFREGDPRTHGLGLAVDIAVEEKGTSQARYKILSAARTVGITRIGFYNHHIHLDIGDRVDLVKFPPECIWWGVSR